MVQWELRLEVCVIGMVASARVWRESQDSGVTSVGMDGLTSLQPAAHVRVVPFQELMHDACPSVWNL